MAMAVHTASVNAKKFISLPLGELSRGGSIWRKLLWLRSLGIKRSEVRLKTAGARRGTVGSNFCKLLEIKGWVSNYFSCANPGEAAKPKPDRLFEEARQSRRKACGHKDNAPMELHSEGLILLF